MKVVILGAGESGVGAALLASKLGEDVFVSDYGTIQPHFKQELENASIVYEDGGHSVNTILSADIVVKSPGIPEKASIIQQIRAKGIELVSEIEYASRYTKAQLIAITGSNGKTTTTNLTYRMLKNAGYDVAMVGNVGKSFARVLANRDYDYFVIEVSSFQLDDIHTFQPKVAVLTNITPDHLDRYGYELSNYVASKFRIIENQTSNDAFVYFSDDEMIASVVAEKQIRPKQYQYSLQNEVKQGAYSLGEIAHIKGQENQYNMNIYDFGIQGKHNVANSLAASIVADIVGVRKEIIRKSLQDFKNLEHRMEQVAFVRGIEFINDSKATNINSAWFALESMTKPIVWIAGGVDKGNDYNELMPLVKDKVKALICLGTDNEKLKEAFNGHIDIIEETQSIQQAVKLAYYLSKKDDVVLLSPACASFDLFNNYEDRGNQFKQAVREL